MDKINAAKLMCTSTSSKPPRKVEKKIKNVITWKSVLASALMGTGLLAFLFYLKDQKDKGIRIKYLLFKVYFYKLYYNEVL